MRARRSVRALALCGLVALSGDEPTARVAPPSPGALASIERHLAEREYRASWNRDRLQAPNRRQNLRTYFEPDGIRVHDRTAEGSPKLVSLRLAGAGRAAAVAPVPDGELHSDGPRVEIRRRGLVEWYENRPEGLEQGFTLEARPAGDGPLALELEVSGASASIRGADVVLRSDASGRRLAYGNLVAEDASGRALPARIELASSTRLRLAIDDAGAAYPIAIDPLITSTADAILTVPPPEPNQPAYLNLSLAAAGDVNGDGYGDLALGLPEFDGGLLSEGAVFVFYGSASGIPDGSASEAATQIESDVLTGRLGEAVAAADVNGDGYSDLVTVARYYTQDPQSRIFVFHGGPEGIDSGSTAIAATEITGASSPAIIFFSLAGACDVNGDGYSDVIAGAGAPTVAPDGNVFVYHGGPGGIADGDPSTADTRIDALQEEAMLGTEVACAGDVNGDGFDDAIVAASEYDGLAANSSAALVYHGSATGIPDGDMSTAAARFETAQTDAILGGDLFVDGAGDVNGDGYADVIVGEIYYDAGQGQDEGAAWVLYGGSAGIGGGDPSTAITRIESDQAGAVLGTVAGAGDVNGDGFADVFVGAAGYDPEGAAFVFLGGSGGIASGNPTSAAMTLQESTTGFGTRVVGAGDLDGDGFGDVAVLRGTGLPTEVAWVYHGGPLGLVDGNPSTARARIESNEGGAFLGASVAGAGDVNGDGLADVIVGASNMASGEGRAFVFSGPMLGGLDATAASGAIVSGQAATSLGISVAAAGDVNGDGYADVIVGASAYDAGDTNEGAAFVFHGGASGVGADSALSADAQLESDLAFAALGASVAGAGDVNGDGYGDVIVGAPSYSAGTSGEGAAFVFHGGPAGVEDGNPASADAQLESNQFLASLGSSVAGAGDVNGDGYADVVVGAGFYDNGNGDEGAAFVFHGGPTGVGDGDPTNDDGQLEANESSAYLGRTAGSVAGAGDVNGDGFADVIVGCYGCSSPGGAGGAALVFHGGASGVGNGDPTNADALLEGAQTGAAFGYGVGGAGDVNGDGYADVVVGASGWDGPEVDEGAAFVFLGGATGVGSRAAAAADARFESDQASAGLGESVAGAGDVDGDGLAEVIVGARQYDQPLSGEGTAYLFSPGNEGRAGRASSPRAITLAPSLRPVAPWGAVGEADVIHVEMEASSPIGRERVRVQVETCREGFAFGGIGCSLHNGGWWDPGVSAAGLLVTQPTSEIFSDELYRWRARVQYAPLGVTQPGITAPPNPRHGPWRRPTAQAFDADTRTPPDSDGDDVPDASDVCPYAANSGQEDDGSWGLLSPTDGIGNACQCGSVAGDGRVDGTDVAAFRAFLANPSGAALSAEALTRCAVHGDLAPCDVVQVTVMRRGLEVPALAPLLNAAAAQHCDAALAP